jgi:hypothetical protein
MYVRMIMSICSKYARAGLRPIKREVRQMAKIFVRERRHAGEGAGRPRFTIVGVQGADLKIFNTKVRRKELEQVAAGVGAELVYLTRGEGNQGHRSGSHGRRHRRGGGED